MINGNNCLRIFTCLPLLSVMLKVKPGLPHKIRNIKLLTGSLGIIVIIKTKELRLFFSFLSVLFWLILSFYDPPPFRVLNALKSDFTFLRWVRRPARSVILWLMFELFVFEVVRQFRDGGYNTLVSTCVGEEGLDIGEVDLIICFDAQKSPIRLIQRMGRTGRRRQGRIVVILSEGREERVSWLWNRNNSKTTLADF